MEPYPGVFVSASSAEAWEPDPEVGGEMHVLCDGEGIQSGLSRFTEIDDGQVLELTAGDIASLPAGSRTTWYLTTPFKEFWVIASGVPVNERVPGSVMPESP
jgi:hypothetical protein